MAAKLRPPKFWMMPLQWFVAFFVGLILMVVGKITALLVVPPAIWAGWDTDIFGKRIFWAWDCYPNAVTGTYYDRWYSMPRHENHSKLSRWAWNKGGFWREYYWRVRNSFSNGARYLLADNAKWTVSESGEPVQLSVYRKDFKHGYYQYDTERWWLAKFRYDRPLIGKLRLQYYIGWKFERTEGFGLTNRDWFWPFAWG